MHAYWETLDCDYLFLTGETEDICIVERLFSSSLVAIVSLSAPRKLKVCHFKVRAKSKNHSWVVVSGGDL